MWTLLDSEWSFHSAYKGGNDVQTNKWGERCWICSAFSNSRSWESWGGKFSFQICLSRNFFWWKFWFLSRIDKKGSLWEFCIWFWWDQMYWSKLSVFSVYLTSCPQNRVQFSSLDQSCPDCLWPHRQQHARLPCPSPTPWACSNSCSSSRWCHPTISSSVIPFSYLQSLPASGSFQMSQFFALGGPKYWSFSFQWIFRTIFIRIDWFDLFAVQGTLKSLLQHHSSKASILRCSAFFTV